MTLIAFALVATYLARWWSRIEPSRAWRFTAGGMVVLVLLEWLLPAIGAPPAPLSLAAVALGIGHIWRARAATPAPAAPALAAASGGAPASSARAGLSVVRSRAAALQAEGRLEEAWQVLRSVPMGTPLLADLSGLATAFEATGQHAQALAVIEQMASFDVPDATALRLAPELTPRALRTRLARARQRAGQALAVAPEPAMPGRLGRYVVERALARGSMGVLYLGNDPEGTGPAGAQRVALKTMVLDPALDTQALGEMRQRFAREADLAARLTHPNIVRIHESGVEPSDARGAHTGLAWIAMEWLRGENLVPSTRADRLLPLPMVLAIAERVALALAHAHGLGVVHRDIKPANIMLDLHASDVPASVKVTDFGIARVSDGARTRTGMVLGTPSFMAPEQLAGRALDGRSDLYALGVTTFQLLTGRLPFGGESMGDLMYKIANVGAPDVRSLRPELPEAVANIVALALEKRPEVRYGDGRQMAQDLQAVAAALHRPGARDRVTPP